MSRIRTSLAVLALVAASVPLHAQSAPYDAGSFTLELPPGISRLTLVRRVDDPAQSFEGYVGGGYQTGMVMVMRTVHRGLPQLPGRGDPAALRRLMADTSSARWRRFREAPLDTSAAGRRAFEQVLGDTSLATRRFALQHGQSLFSRGNDWIRMQGDGREIVAEDRITRRSPVTIDMDRAPMHGIADVSVPRRGGLEVWVVMFAAMERTPAVEAAAARMLDSFRPKSARTDTPAVH